ncbi:hypothetical protein SEA_JACKO_98 [Microbacterium phage Jacko]|nr:hypothetical protein SEA_JACKO_98 [Microbacterium phage Jacko]
MDKRTQELMAEPRYERLPKWVRNEIERLAGNAEHYQAKMRDMIEDKTGEGTNTSVERLVGADVPLPDGTWIEFRLDNGARMSVRNNGDHVEVRSTEWRKNLAVLPRSGNAVGLVGIDR